MLQYCVNHVISLIYTCAMTVVKMLSENMFQPASNWERDCYLIMRINLLIVIVDVRR